MGWQATSLTGQNWQRQSLLQPTKHLFDPFPVLLAPLESRIFLLLVDGVLISETTKGTKLQEGVPFTVSLLFRRVFVVKFGRYPPLLSIACSAMPQTSYNFRSFRASFEPVRNLLS